jgi:hypothetical protein
MIRDPISIEVRITEIAKHICDRVHPCLTEVKVGIALIGVDEERAVINEVGDDVSIIVVITVVT